MIGSTEGVLPEFELSSTTRILLIQFGRARVGCPVTGLFPLLISLLGTQAASVAPAQPNWRTNRKRFDQRDKARHGWRRCWGGVDARQKEDVLCFNNWHAHHSSSSRQR